MKKVFAAYNAYTGQYGPDDCGIACLSMLLRLNGRYQESERLISEMRGRNGAVSLLELRELAVTAGLNARCVRMDMPTLAGLGTPCILHVLNRSGAYHFVVCNIAKTRQGLRSYLISDPATGIYWMREEDLTAIWKTGAALYPDKLLFQLPPYREQTWFQLVRSISGYEVLLYSIPLLTVFATLLGIALSWMLQRGLDQPLYERNLRTLVPVVLLLGIVMLARNMAAFVKQKILIRVHLEIRRKYLSTLHDRQRSRRSNDQQLRRALLDLQKIQTGVNTLFTAFFSDGILIVLITSSMWVLVPIVALILTIYITSILFIAVSRSSEIIWTQAVVEQLSADMETSMGDPFGNFGMTEIQNNQSSGLNDLSNSTQRLARLINVNQLRYENWGTAAVIAVLADCLTEAARGELSNTELTTCVIAAFFVTMLTGRVAQSVPALLEGALSLKKFRIS